MQLFITQSECMVLIAEIAVNHIEHPKLNYVQLAETKEDVLAGLRLVGKAEGWPENISLSDWLQRLQAKYRTGAQMEKSIQLISAYCYGRIDENKLKNIVPILTDELKKYQKSVSKRR